MTTPNRKRGRLLENLRGIDSTTIKFIPALPRQGDPNDPRHEPGVLYVSRKTLIQLLKSEGAEDE